MNEPIDTPQDVLLHAGLNGLIEKRRSIKPADFSDRPVEDEVVWQMLNNANWAPTHGQTEPWRFYVYSGESRVVFGRRLAEIYQEIIPAEAVKPG